MKTYKPKKSPLSEEDRQLFRQHMKGIIPLQPADKILLRRKPPSSTSLKSEQLKISTQQQLTLLDQGTPLMAVTAEQALQFHRSGLSLQLIKKLKKGQFAIENTLDLHRLNRKQAKLALINFINDCQQQHFRCVCIIHGKGSLTSATNHPILKNSLNIWLRQLPSILAFTSALPKHGGSGAMYVLLKR